MNSVAVMIISLLLIYLGVTGRTEQMWNAITKPKG